MKPRFYLLPTFVFAARLGAAEPVLTVHSAEKTLTVTEKEFASLPHAEITTLEAHIQHEHRYTGVAVRELLLKADRGRQRVEMLAKVRESAMKSAFRDDGIRPPFRGREIVVSADATDRETSF